MKINSLTEIDEIVGLQISYEKTKYITNISDGSDLKITDYGKIRLVKNLVTG